MSDNKNLIQHPDFNDDSEVEEKLDKDEVETVPSNDGSVVEPAEPVSSDVPADESRDAASEDRGIDGAQSEDGPLDGGKAGTADDLKMSKPWGLLKNKKVAYFVAALGACIVVIWILFATHVICFHQNWIGATCEEPRRCADCGKTDGEPLGHEWVDATCTEPKTCMRCGKSKGEPAGHKTEGWTQPVVDILAAEEKSNLTCTVCGEIVDSKSTTLKSFVRDGKFIFSPSDFCRRLRDKVDMEAIDGGKSDLISYALVKSMSNREMCAMLSFTTMDGQTNLGDSCKNDSSCSPSPVLIVDTKKCNSAEMMIGLVMSCDPSLSRSDATEVAKALAGSVSGTSGSTEKNGITYLLAGIDERVMFRAVVG